MLEAFREQFTDLSISGVGITLGAGQPHGTLGGCALILSFVTHPFLEFGQIASSVRILDPQ